MTISANAELEPDDDEPEPPRLPAVALPPATPEPLEDEPDEDEPVEAFVVEPPDTVSPGEALESDTIVPLVGAYSFVLASAICALWTLA